jgi:hypothetical protein
MLLSLLQPLLAMALAVWCDVGVDTALVLMILVASCALLYVVATGCALQVCQQMI